MSKIKVVLVRIIFSEDPTIQKNEMFPSMEDANAFLSAKNLQEKRRGLPGYNKTDFAIIFEDGSEYKGRYDIGAEDGDLSAHVRQFAECYSGRVKPLGLTDAQWKDFIAQSSKRQIEYYGYVLDNYEF